MSFCFHTRRMGPFRNQHPSAYYRCLDCRKSLPAPLWDTPRLTRPLGEEKSGADFQEKNALVLKTE